MRSYLVEIGKFSMYNRIIIKSINTKSLYEETVSEDRFNLDNS